MAAWVMPMILDTFPIFKISQDFLYKYVFIAVNYYSLEALDLLQKAFDCRYCIFVAF